MKPTLSPQEFVAKWHAAPRRERANSQEHFIDLCRLVGHPTPGEHGPYGLTFTFEAGAQKSTGGRGFSDVWYEDHFGWEYKGKDGDLDSAYDQLLLYKEALRNPPLLIVSDMDRIVVFPNFNNNVNRRQEIRLEEIVLPDRLEQLKAIFYDPQAFKSPETKKQVTEGAATEFARLAELLRKYGADPQRAAHFLIRVLFCLFAEDIGLLPSQVFTKLIKSNWMRPTAFAKQVQQLFGVMATGGYFGVDEIHRFNGGLFNDAEALSFDTDGMEILSRICELDWSSIEPSILGTLFRRGLDPTERAQLGAQYTSKEDILTVLEPVLIEPLRRQWNQIQGKANDLVGLRNEAKSTRTQTKLNIALKELLSGFANQLAQVQVLDPASGSGNFLYLALKELLDLWKEVSVFGSKAGLPMLMPDINPAPYPAQMHGIEINTYAHELANASVWIGYIQWRRDNGFGDPPEPILRPLEMIRQRDAILTYDASGQPAEPEWPLVDVIIGNPPFLGDKKMRRKLGDKYVDDLRSLYGNRIPGQSDVVCYWFEKARKMIEAGRAKRAGLLATQGIRGGANRRVLERIKETGDIFVAWSDRPWILDGAAVHVSMICFDNGTEKARKLNDKSVTTINSDLSTSTDLGAAKPLVENSGLAFIGTQKSGPFELSELEAQRMIRTRGNPNGRTNSDVIKPWVNGQDLTRRPRHMWIIDFGAHMPMEEAAQYEKPFEYVRKYVKPMRDKVKRKNHRERWWLHGETRPGMRGQLDHLPRFIATPRVSKHRVFTWLDKDVIPDCATVVIARADDYFFGVLQSQVHETWSRRKGTQLREFESGARYSETLTFETFPFPWAPGHEPLNDPRVQRIAVAACELVAERDRWLGECDLPEDELKKRTLTDLYNERPTWLDLAHRKLDEAVLDAYGWSHDLADDELLPRLLSLNMERAA